MAAGRRGPGAHRGFRHLPHGHRPVCATTGTSPPCRLCWAMKAQAWWKRSAKRSEASKHGDHVVLSYRSCGRCRNCRKERPMDCSRFWEANFGFKRLNGSNALQKSGVRGHFFGQSSFSTHALATERNLVRVSKDLSLEVLAPLGLRHADGSGRRYELAGGPCRESHRRCQTRRCHQTGSTHDPN